MTAVQDDAYSDDESEVTYVICRVCHYEKVAGEPCGEPCV